MLFFKVSKFLEVNTLTAMRFFRLFNLCGAGNLYSNYKKKSTAFLDFYPIKGDYPCASPVDHMTENVSIQTKS